MLSIDIGTKVGDFTLVKRLGFGASGCVYHAVDYNNNSFALKFIPTRNPVEAKVFVNEVTIMSKFPSSDFIVRMHEHFTWGFYGVIVMTLFQEDLLTWITEAPKEPSIEQIQQVFKQICLAVATLHNAGIAHLDLKPENVFCSSIGTVKLGDFGGSVNFGGRSVNSLNIQRGTLHYMAPEMALMEVTAPEKADIWSLGILLHVLLFSHWPYHYEEEKDLPQVIGSGDVKYYEGFELLDNDVKVLLKRMLRKKPQARPSIHEILNSEWLKSVDCSFHYSEIHSLAPSPDLSAKRKISPKVVKKFFSSVFTGHSKNNR